MRFFSKVLVLLILAGVLSPSNVNASILGTTGTLTGKVTDVQTGESLPGVNIVIVGSGRGTVTTVKGEFAITGVTPGVYTVVASLIGYKNAEAKKVAIDADQTTVYNFRLASTDIEMEGVTVEGQRPVVDIRKTASDQTFNKDKIEALPNLKGVEDVLALQAGVVKFGAQLFLRGGRANETQILVDGVPVNDVAGGGGAAGTQSTNEQLQQLYSGTATGSGGGLSVAANAIQSVSVSSGGLDAEYGNAQSGVVNITTKSGSETYAASGQFRSDGIVADGFNDRYYAGSLSGPEPITNSLLPSLGIQFPGKMSFFVSGNFNQTDGPYGYNTKVFYNPVQRKIKFGGIFQGLLDGLGFTYSDRQTNAFAFNMKLSYLIGESDQFTYSYRANASSAHPLRYTYRDRHDSTSSSVTLNTQNVLQWSHILGTNSLLKGYLSRLETQGTSSVGHLTPPQYSTITNTSLYDPSQDGFNDLGTGQGWSTSRTVIWNTKFDFQSQIHRLHFFKAGIDYHYEELTGTTISFPTAPLAERIPDSLGGTRGLYPGYGSGRWITNNMPSRGALYVQDNIEFTGLNIKVGLRYDFFYLGKQVFSPDWVGRWESITKEKADWLGNESFFSQFTSGYFSPRLAIGYPVSKTTVFYFNYGHFLQYPDRDEYFHDPVKTNVSGNYVGNPSLRPQKTVQYEAGFDQLVFEDLSVGVRGYYKDIFDYASSRALPVSPAVSKTVNLDYASTRGFEIILNKTLSDNYLGSIGYTFQLAKGRSSNKFATIGSAQLQGLPRETRLSWDQQHTVNLFLSYRVAPNENYTFFGLFPFNNWGSSLTWSYGSGFPYTPYNPGRSVEDLYLINSGDGPFTSEINLSFYKGFRFFEKLNMVFTLDITNLLNRRNVNLNSSGFNSLTGAPTVYGDYNPETKVLYTWAGANGFQSFDARVPPTIFKAPRQISLGMKINWD